MSFFLSIYLSIYIYTQILMYVYTCTKYVSILHIYIYTCDINTYIHIYIYTNLCTRADIHVHTHMVMHTPDSSYFLTLYTVLLYILLRGV